MYKSILMSLAFVGTSWSGSAFAADPAPLPYFDANGKTVACQAALAADTPLVTFVGSTKVVSANGYVVSVAPTLQGYTDGDAVISVPASNGWMRWFATLRNPTAADLQAALPKRRWMANPLTGNYYYGNRNPAPPPFFRLNSAPEKRDQPLKYDWGMH